MQLEMNNNYTTATHDFIINIYKLNLYIFNFLAFDFPSHMKVVLGSQSSNQSGIVVSAIISKAEHCEYEAISKWIIYCEIQPDS